MKQEMEREVALFRGRRMFEIEQVCGILERNHIPYDRRDCPKTLEIPHGHGWLKGNTVIVYESDYERARELIWPFLEEFPEETKQERRARQKRQDKALPRFWKVLLWMAYIFTGMMGAFLVGMVLWVIITSTS